MTSAVNDIVIAGTISRRMVRGISRLVRNGMAPVRFVSLCSVPDTPAIASLANNHVQIQ